VPKIGVTGAHVWYKLPNILVFWLELGPRKTPEVLKGGATLAAMAATIPVPWGPIIAAVMGAKLVAIRAAAGPKGVWVKFGPAGAYKWKTRTDQNKEKMPNPF
jgi:hypothetical protein